jgi:hypothetical protein
LVPTGKRLGRRLELNAMTNLLAHDPEKSVLDVIGDGTGFRARSRAA